MSLGEKVRRLLIKLGLRYLPPIGIGAIIAQTLINEPKLSKHESVIESVCHNPSNISPDAKRLAFSTNQFGKKRDADIYLSRMNGEDLRSIVATAEDDNFISWLNDGKGVLFSRKNKYFILNLENNEEKFLFEGDAYYLYFSPSGRALRWYSYDGDLNFFDLYSDKKHTIFKAKTDAYIPRVAWNNNCAIFKREERLARFFLDTSVLEEIVQVPVHSFDWAGDSIVYVTTKEPKILHVLKKDNTVEKIQLPFSSHVILGTDGFVALIDKKENTSVYVLDIKNKQVNNLGTWPTIANWEWNKHVLAFNPRVEEGDFEERHYAHTINDDVYVYDAVSQNLRKLTGYGSELFLRWLPDNRLLVLSGKDMPVWPGFALETYALDLEGKMERLTFINAKSQGLLLDYYKRHLPFAGLLGALSTLGVYFSWRARKKRVIKEQHKGFDRVFDHPELLSLGLSCAVFSGIYFGFFDHHRVARSSAQAVALSYFASTALTLWPAFSAGVFDPISRLKSPLRKNIAGAYRLSIRWYSNLFRTSKDVDLLKQSLELCAVEDDETHAMRALLDAHEGRYGRAICNWNAALQFRRRHTEFELSLSSNWFENLTRQYVMLPIYSRRQYARIEKGKDVLSNLLALQFACLRFGKGKNVKELAEKILSLPECTDSYRVLESFILEQVGAGDLAERIRKDTLSLLTRSSEKERIGAEILYWKLGHFDSLAHEKQYLERALQFAGRYDFDVARPLGILPVEGKHCLVEVFSDGIQLYDELEQRPSIATLQKSSDAQAVLHAIMPCPEPKDLHADIDSFLSNAPWQLPKGLGDALALVLQPVWPFQAFDCDGHRKNRHWNVSQQPTIYDLEDRGSAPVAFDYAKLYRQGRRVGSWEQERDLLVQSGEKYNSLAKKDACISAELLPELVLRSSPYKAMRFASFAFDKPERRVEAQQSVANALEDIFVLRETSSLKHALEVQRDALLKIQDSYNALA